MQISYFDDARVTEARLKKNQKTLQNYRQQIETFGFSMDFAVPEFSLYYPKSLQLNDTLESIKKSAKSLKHVVLIGIGGSSLGLEAVHAVLDTGKTKLSVLDTVSVSKIEEVREELSKYKKASQIAVCVVSKSGSTTETLVNASIVLDDLVGKFGPTFYSQVYFIGNPGTDFMKQGKRLKANVFPMPSSIGGRYSLATEVGLIPLALLGHDTEEFMSGYLDANSTTLESVVAESASRIAIYHNLKFPHYTFFAFESRLEKLGKWYRQLFAESLGKETTKAGKVNSLAMVPTIATAVELHSVGQLYMSGVADVYTDFVSFDDEFLDVMISKKTTIAKNLRGYSVQEVATALYGGVIGAYQTRQLPYRATVFEENLAYSLGQFMAMRMREVMYVANLLDLNAFDQPNVELYKDKTKEILFI
jgi:glucose-6-phosphate isomerase